MPLAALTDRLIAPEYSKIETLFDRDKNTFKVLADDPAVFRIPEFAAIDTWRAYEKLDGTNVRLTYERSAADDPRADVCYSVGGRTNKAQFNDRVYGRLTSLAHNSAGRALELLTEHGIDALCIYGEAVGAGIQKGGGNYVDGHRVQHDFYAFDMKVLVRRGAESERWVWLNQDAVAENLIHLNLKMAPIMWTGPTDQLVNIVRNGFDSPTALVNGGKQYKAEGVILRPRTDLYTGHGRRVMAKLKTKDF